MRLTYNLSSPVFALVLAALQSGACANNPTTPTPPDPLAISITCPAPVTVLSPLNVPISVVYTNATGTSGAPPVSVTCTPASGSIFQVGTTFVSCTATDARSRAASCAFPVAVAAPPHISLTRFVAFGDSITAGEIGSALNPYLKFFDPTDAYPAVLKGLLTARYTAQTVTVANQGLVGERAADPSTLLRFNAVVSSGLYQSVMLMEGSNDLVDKDSQVIPAVIAALRAMIRNAVSRNIRPFLATVPPQDPTRCSPICRGAGAALVEPLDDAIRALAASEGVTLVDVYPVLATNIPHYIGADGLHPTADGDVQIANTFFDVLKQALEQRTSPTPTFRSRR